MPARILAFAFLIAALAFAPALGQTPKDLQWSHAFDLQCRKLGEAEFSPTTQSFGIEALRDLNNNLGLYVTEKGSISLAPGFADLKLPVAEQKPVWITGLDLPARKAGEKEFTKATKVYCLEIFRDPHTNNCLYITADDNVAAAPIKAKVEPGSNKGPEFVHSVDLNVRKGGITDWTGATKVGVEIYRDGNTGNLIYITDTGSIAVIPETGQAKANNKAPDWLHGLDLAVRKPNEPTFTKETRVFGVELFRDQTNGNLIYLSETGSIAVVPDDDDKRAAPTANVQKPAWTHGWNVKVRRPGEKEFVERTKTFGGETFRDENVGAILAICETGAISAAKAK